MIARPTRWIVSAILSILVAGAAVAVTNLALGSLTISTAQVGVPFSATLQASGGNAPYTYSITGGALPNGLTYSPTASTAGAMTISGTPTAAGTYSFTVAVFDTPLVSDTLPSSPGTDSKGPARRRGLAQSGNNAAGTSSPFTITVSPAAIAAAGAPT